MQPNMFQGRCRWSTALTDRAVGAENEMTEGRPEDTLVAMTSSDLWDAETAERYDDTSAFMFEPDVLDPAVDFLADLAGDGPALELAIGTGRVAIPLADRGIAVSGIELSEPMIDQLHRKKPDFPVVVGALLH